MGYQIFNSSCSLIPQEIFYVNWKKYYQDYHQHKAGCIEIDYIAEGFCTYHLGKRSVHLNRHSMLIHNGENPHDYEVPESCLNMSILCSQEKLSISSGSLEMILFIYPYMDSFFRRLDEGIVLKNAGNLFPLVKEINDAFLSGTPKWHLNLLTNKLLIDSLNSAYYQTPSRIYTEEIKDYIRYHYFEIQSLDDIAEHLSLNKIYMERVFKQETGTSIWSYLNNIRMENAAYYVTQPELPIGEIDELLGIHSRQNFYLLFRKKYGISPAQYRKLHLTKHMEFDSPAFSE